MLERAGFIARLIGTLRGHGGQGGGLQSGQTVHAKVLTHAGNNTWRLSIGGRVFSARVTVPIQPGQEFMARVEQRGGEVVLRQLQLRGAAPGLERVLDAAGVPRNAVSEAIISPLVHARRPLNPDQIARLYRLSRRLGASTRRSARLLAVAHGKGLMPENASALSQLESAVDLSADSGDMQNRGEPEGHGQEQRRQSSRGSPQEDSRYELLAAAEEPGSLRQVFNHLGSAEGHWLAIPIRFTVGSEEHRAVLRLYRPPGARRYEEGTLEVALGDRRLAFGIGRMPGGFAVRVHAEDRDSAVLRDLAGELESSPEIQNLSIGEGLETFDGFSSEDLSTIVYGVDTDV